MGFSLKKLVKHAVDDINPFDGPARPTPAAPPRPASTAQPTQRANPLSVQPVQKPLFQAAPITQPKPIQPLKATVAAPQPLHVGNTVVNQSPTARSGVSAGAPQAPSFLDQVRAFDTGAASSIYKGVGQIAHTPELLRAATPNFIPGVSKYVDPALKTAGNALATPFERASQGIDNAANDRGLYDTKQGQAARNFGNQVGGGATFLATGGAGAIGDAAKVVKAAPAVIKAAPEATTKLVNAVNDARTPLGNNALADAGVGAVGRDVRPTVAPSTKLVPQLSDEAAPTIAKPVSPAFGVDSLPDTTAKPPVVGNALTKKVALQNISPEAQKLVSGDHNIRNTQALGERGQAAVDKLSTKKTIEQAHVRLAVGRGNISDEDVSFVAKAIEKAGAAGKDREEAALHDSLSEHLTAAGQKSQAAQLLYNLSPQGRYYKAIKDINKASPKNQKISPELDKQLKTLTQQIKKAPDTVTKQKLTAQFQKLVVDSVPKSAANKALSIWKAGLLSGVKTQGGNFVSNATFGALKELSNPIATGIDKILSVATKERTKTSGLGGRISGAREGLGNGWDTLKTGIDKRNISGDKYELHGELHFKNKIIDKVVAGPTNMVFRGMSAADQPFYYASFKNNLYDVAKADGINQGLKGQALKDYTIKMANAPTHKMADIAKTAADKAVLGQDNAVSTFLGQANRISPKLGTVISTVAPFTKVPTNFLTRTLDYTPVGAIKGAVKSIQNSRAGEGIAQRQLAEAIGEATTGTGLIYLGAELAKHKLLSGQYPTGDAKEAARWKAEGITPNSIKIGNKWVSLNYLGPVGLLFGSGKDYHDAAASGDNGALAAIAGTGKNLEGQSFLTGLNNFANAVNDPQRYGQSVVNQYSGSVVPNLVNDAANLGDNNQREANGPIDTIKSRIPGARNTLPVKNDVYGNDLTQRTSKFNLLANPLRPSDTRTNDVIGEVARLHNVDPTNKDLQVTPTPLDKAITVSGNKVKLSPTQRHDLQKQIGQDTQNNWDRLIKTPEYKALSDTDKANALNGLRQATTEDAQRKYVVDNNLGAYDKAASKSAIRAQQGDVSSFAKAKGEDGNYSTTSSDLYKSDDSEYKSLQAKFDDSVKYKRFNSDAQKIKAQDKLNKAKVGSAYSKDVRDLYALSRNELADYLSTDPKGNAKAKQLIAYDQALTAAGIQAKDKFKNGVITRTPTAGSKSRSASNSKFAAALKAQNSAASDAQDALLNLVKGAKVASKNGNPKNVQVSKVALKKQSVKKSNTKVKVA